MLKYDTPFTPPPQLGIAGWLLLGELVAVVALVVSRRYTGLSVPAIQLIAIAINSAACVYLGIAATRLGKSWLLYGLLPGVLPAIFVAYFSYSRLRMGAWLAWADQHATYVADR